MCNRGIFNIATAVVLGALLALHLGDARAAGFDPWHRSPILDGIDRFNGEIVEPRRWSVVDEGMQLSAQEKLANSSYYELREKEIPVYCSVAFAETNRGKRLFLVRGVYEDVGQYTIRHMGRDLSVNNFSMGRPTSMHRQALVVALDFEPARIYPTSSGAE